MHRRIPLIMIHIRLIVCEPVYRSRCGQQVVALTPQMPLLSPAVTVSASGSSERGYIKEMPLLL